ncbi:predicted protein [Naegleria gruberi]|uniref:Predicted protein n=1 Tax=Naegleria gruberi TaxID=5762 RepID=D2W5Y9_NAEGR|nr:uncharacterized protein NAEGRDRAFT_76833 [Naegleria gruberi]EFC35512.1 predicted protein [Naegleria gruberi]|eukprot:XP_002668256.1 predicted protein [Naegleria gruberi strain NEG-M]
MSDIVPKFKKVSLTGAPFSSDAEYYKTLRNYELADAHARNAPKDIPTLTETSKYLCSPFDNIEEKARSVYVWLCLNLTYDKVNRKNHTLPKYNAEVMGPSFSEEEKKIYNDFALCAFYLKTCVCTGFAGLFEGKYFYSTMES